MLERLAVQIKTPVLYGDTTWYGGRVVSKETGENGTRVRVEITGTNQVGIVNTTGEADVLFPPDAVG